MKAQYIYVIYAITLHITCMHVPSATYILFVKKTLDLTQAEQISLRYFPGNNVLPKPSIVKIINLIG